MLVTKLYSSLVWRNGRTRNAGDRKFSMNQNLTVLSVFLSTLRIMIPTKR